MADFSWVHIASAAGGSVLTIAAAVALVWRSPTPWRNLLYGALALGMFAVGASAKLDLSLSQDKGLEIKVARLERLLEEQSFQLASLSQTNSTAQLASLEKSVESQATAIRKLNSTLNTANLPQIAAQLQTISQKTTAYDKFFKDFVPTVQVNDRGLLTTTQRGKRELEVIKGLKVQDLPVYEIQPQ